MINTVIVLGKPGSGKSIMIWYLHSLLDEDGFKIKHLSDRLELEKGVLKDTQEVKPEKDGVIIGKHSKLIADGPPGHRKVHVLDGLILNKVHVNHIKTVAKNKNSEIIYLIEYAIGPDIDFGKSKEPLLQCTDHLVKNIISYKLQKNVFILDVDAPLSVREIREMKRPDAMAPETFRSYFPDGGEMKKSDARRLGEHYYRFSNCADDHDGYFSEAKFIYETKIQPKLR